MASPRPITPLETLFDRTAQPGMTMPVPLPPALADLYGALAFAAHPGRPYVISNFVSSLDGVVALDTPGVDDGSTLSGGLPQDKLVMGLLRTVCDAVVVGAGTLNAIPKYLLTAEGVFRPLAGEYRALRTALGKPPAPLHVIISGRGDLDLSARIFQSGEVPALIVTTPEGQARIEAAHALPPTVTIAAPPSEAPHAGEVSAAAVLVAITATLGASAPVPLVLVEGGPHVLGTFLAEQRLNELFLTFSPQVAGRDARSARPGFAAGALFAPVDPRWAVLLSLKRAESALFLRYAFQRSDGATGE